MGSYEWVDCEYCKRIADTPHQHHFVYSYDTEVSEHSKNWNYHVITCNAEGCPGYYERETCNTDGPEGVCSLCGNNPSEHIHQKGTFHAATVTCTTPGNIAYYDCADSSCDKKITKDGLIVDNVESAALGHIWSYFIRNYDGTHTIECKRYDCFETNGTESCDEYGENGCCSKCNYNRIDMHEKATKHEAKEATCTEAGNIEYWDCKDPRCSVKLVYDSVWRRYYPIDNVSIPALGHDWSGKDGICARSGCGQECDHNGATTGTCAICGKVLHTHTKGNHYEAVEATCLAAEKVEYWDCTDTDCSEKLDASGNVLSSIAGEAAKGHSFTNYVSDNNATCTADGTKTAKCDRCDETDTVTELGTATGNHDFVDQGNGKHECSVCHEQGNHDFPAHEYLVDDAGNHYQVCTTCGGESVHEAHTGGTATCTKKAKCSTCGKEYGSLAAHSYSSDWSTNGTNHWHECSVCGNKKDSAAHVDEDKNEKCDVCGYEMHKHSGTKVNQVDATCTADGVKAYYKCSCGKYYTDSACTKEITDLAAWKVGDGKIAKKGHSGGTATCKAKAKCETCGKEYGSLADHSYSTKWSSDGTNHWHACTVCGAKKDSAAHTLKTTTTKATLTANSKKETKCTVCNKVTKTQTIYAAKTIKLSATTYTYDGKVKKPSVTIKDSKGNTIASTNYTVTYPSGRKNVGKYTVKVTFKGNYSGSKNLAFKINLPKTSISSVGAGKKAFTVKWAKKTTQVTGYQIQYSTSSTFASGNKTVTVTSAKTVSKTISKLTGGKKYYVRIRTYKTVSGTKYYSDWSAKKAVTTKK